MESKLKRNYRVAFEQNLAMKSCCLLPTKHLGLFQIVALDWTAINRASKGSNDTLTEPLWNFFCISLGVLFWLGKHWNWKNLPKILLCSPLNKLFIATKIFFMWNFKIWPFYYDGPARKLACITSHSSCIGSLISSSSSNPPSASPPLFSPLSKNWPRN